MEDGNEKVLNQVFTKEVSDFNIPFYSPDEEKHIERADIDQQASNAMGLLKTGMFNKMNKKQNQITTSLKDSFRAKLNEEVEDMESQFESESILSTERQEEADKMDAKKGADKKQQQIL